MRSSRCQTETVSVSQLSLPAFSLFTPRNHLHPHQGQRPFHRDLNLLRPPHIVVVTPLSVHPVMKLQNAVKRAVTLVQFVTVDDLGAAVFSRPQASGRAPPSLL